MHFIFLMDPLETVNVKKDTSFIFMVGARRAGHRCYYLPQGGITAFGNRLTFRVQPVTPRPDKPVFPFDVEEAVMLTDEQVDAVFVRTEPPFDDQYLMDTWLLETIVARVPVLNSPRGLRECNEKLWTLQFPELIPPTLVTRHRADYEQFRAEHGKVIVKPTDAKGGEGVFLVQPGDSNAIVIFETMTDRGRREVIVQQFVAEASAGDKRILLLGGEFLSVLMRVQPGSDHRHNFFAGGQPRPGDLTARDRQIIDTLRPHLQTLDLHFTGIDVLGDYLIEVNVTSPTCVQECNRLYGQRLEDQVIAYVESLVAQKRAVV